MSNLIDHSSENERPYQEALRYTTLVLRGVFVIFMAVSCGCWLYQSIDSIKKIEEARTNFHASCGTFATGEACNQLWVAVQMMIQRDIDEPQNWTSIAIWTSTFVVCTIVITLLGPWKELARLCVIAYISDRILSNIDKGREPFADTESDSSILSDM